MATIEMTKEYIRDHGRVRLCTSNIAKMNLFESMYYHRFRMWKNIIDTINDLKEHWYIIINLFIVVIFPVVYPIIAWWKIQRARKEMERVKGNDKE